MGLEGLCRREGCRQKASSDQYQAQMSIGEHASEGRSQHMGETLKHEKEAE